MNKTVQQMARAMLDESGTPATFWGEVAFSVVTILNQANVRVNSTQTRHELWYGKAPRVLKFLEANVISKGLVKKLVSLNPEKMKVFFLVILTELKDINVIIKDLGKLLKALML